MLEGLGLVRTPNVYAGTTVSQGTRGELMALPGSRVLMLLTLTRAGPGESSARLSWMWCDQVAQTELVLEALGVRGLGARPLPCVSEARQAPQDQPWCTGAG